MMHLLADITAVMAAIGVIVTMLGLAAVYRFARRPPAPALRAPVSILKPLCGDEPLLEEALETFCRLDYPEFELILGVQDPDDPALLVADRVRRRFPGCAITIVVDPALHGPNRKVSNLINMLPAARHDVLVFSDSDLHVAPDYLTRVVGAMEQPGVGLVTTVCVGLPSRPKLVALLGAMQISYSFLPGVLLSRVLGRQDCLGTTMALHRTVLARTGGLPRLLHHLADDHVLGQGVLALGLSIALADTVPSTSVPETSLTALWWHELRWARTIGALAPLPFLGSTVQFPLFWAALAMLLSGGKAWCAELFLATWAVRVACACGVDWAFRRPRAAMPLLLAAWLMAGARPAVDRADGGELLRPSRALARPCDARR
ncbi:MAG: bacteriohopanetetrol glucosamine biosynthesis glycosyltransferase HpnI [Acetobacteraceae bacterium]